MDGSGPALRSITCGTPADRPSSRALPEQLSAESLGIVTHALRAAMRQQPHDSRARHIHTRAVCFGASETRAVIRAQYVELVIYHTLFPQQHRWDSIWPPHPQQFVADAGRALEKSRTIHLFWKQWV
jgi:hypothetical protein